MCKNWFQNIVMTKLDIKHILLFFSVLLANCSKEQNTYINLKFYDVVTLKECHDVKVNIYEMDDLAYLNTGFKKLIQTYNTYNSNTLEIYLEGLNNRKKYWAVFESNLSCFSTQGIEIIPNERNIYYRHLYGKLNFKVHIKNIMPYNNDDKIRLEITNNINPDAIYWPKYVSFNATGDIVDRNEANFFEGLRFEELYFKSSVRKNNIYTNRIDTIKVTSCDTVKYELLY